MIESKCEENMFVIGLVNTSNCGKLAKINRSHHHQLLE